MYIKIPTGKYDRILMLRALATSITANDNHPFDVVAPTEYQSTMSLFEGKYAAYKAAKNASETNRQSRDLMIKDIETSVVKIAQYLKVKFYGNEKAIVDWGFPVLLGKRSGIIARDRKTESNIRLYKQILAKHVDDGENSILSSYDMAAFETKLNSIIATHTNFKENRTLARIYAKQHQNLLKDLLAMARKIARNLRMREDMEPKDLEVFGFTVLESYASADTDEDEEGLVEEDIDQAS
jgi:hypothetical protein